MDVQEKDTCGFAWLELLTRHFKAVFTSRSPKCKFHYQRLKTNVTTSSFSDILFSVTLSRLERNSLRTYHTFKKKFFAKQMPGVSIKGISWWPRIPLTDFGCLWMQHVVRQLLSKAHTKWVISGFLQASIMTPTLKAFLITGAIRSLSNLTPGKYNHFRFGVCFPTLN